MLYNHSPIGIFVGSKWKASCTRLAGSTRCSTRPAAHRLPGYLPLDRFGVLPRSQQDVPVALGPGERGPLVGVHCMLADAVPPEHYVTAERRKLRWGSSAGWLESQRTPPFNQTNVKCQSTTRLDGRSRSFLSNPWPAALVNIRRRVRYKNHESTRAGKWLWFLVYLVVGASFGLCPVRQHPCLLLRPRSAPNPPVRSFVRVG